MGEVKERVEFLLLSCSLLKTASFDELKVAQTDPAGSTCPYVPKA